ncbi:aromatic aminotransferase [Schizosaccharomyces japonicus yFS275]|uniref:aromatic-amino-acid transaminase n=1 Tax=Schizosaccharomyces japonicus (strain yFS275 / FY16936) TaxID=402676 RepID=B6K3W8_SCHJY|nr:aromatic aminotransferase [Schizosaccharomyces japonicus yFS275]EEB08175.1 aromatic aminotransferase [Schizosaccharomyces japonicus yFS275]
MVAYQPKDLSHHLSLESSARRPSPLKAAALSKSKTGINIVSLAGGLPHSDYFPIRTLSTAVYRPDGKPENNNVSKIPLQELSLGMEPTEDNDFGLSQGLQYGQGFGALQLAAFVKEHTRIVHQPKYEGWDVMLTAGNTNALDTCLRMLLNRGESLLVEEYTFPSALQTIEPMGINCIPMPMDLNGILPEKLEELLSSWNTKARGCPKPHVMYVIPSGQNPTGSTLSNERRARIYEICQAHDIIILEDEPYYFLQMDNFDGKIPEEQPTVSNETFLSQLITSFLSIDTEGRVIRLDSMSKVVAPGTRLGWLTGHPLFMERALRQNEVNIQSASGLSQVLLHGILHTWGQEGYLEWLKQIRFQYTRRRNALLLAMNKYLPEGLCSYIAPEAGMFIWFEVDRSRYLHSDKFKTVPEIETDIHEQAVDAGVNLACGHWFIVDSSKNDRVFFRVTFAAANFEDFNVAIERFAAVLNKNFK